jgi:hypothetical protein
MIWKSWGVQMMDGMERGGDIFICPYCNYHTHRGTDGRGFLLFIVGYSDSGELGFFECPMCFKVLFHHLNSMLREHLMAFALDDSISFRHPESRDAILKELGLDVKFKKIKSG